MYTLTVTITCKPPFTDSLCQTLSQASLTYMKDQGTLAWLVSRSESDPHQFLIVEVYSSKEGLAVHEANAYFKEFAAVVGPWIEEIDIRKWEGISGSAVLN